MRKDLPPLLPALVVAVQALSALGCATSDPTPESSTWFPDADRIVAIGDVHGDLEAARNALHLAGAMDQDGHWVGGELVVVQTGDVLDRGDDELAIMELLERLKVEARSSGGDVHLLNGNHELMNAYQDFRYVTDGGWAAFQDVPLPVEPDSVLLALEPNHRGRAYSFRPGQEMALRLAERNVVVVVGTTIFSHGGVLPANVEMGLDALNAQARSWLRGEAPEPEWVRGDDSPVWNRLYSREPTQASCDTLTAVLDSLELERMVVGHTVQEGGITGYCGGRVWAIDVGLASHYGGKPEVLEIRGGRVCSLK